METQLKNFVCSIDKRRFATKAALEQHVAASHSSGVKPPKKQNKRGKRQRGNGPAAPLAIPNALKMRALSQTVKDQGSVAQGSEIIGQVTVKADQKPIILARLVVNPSMFLDTRLSQVSELWERWRPLSIKLSVQTALPSTAGGQLLICWDPDSFHKAPTDELSRLKSFSAMRPSRMIHLWEKASISPNAAPQQKWLWVSTDKGEDSNYGVFYVVLTAGVANITGTYTVTVQLDWKIAFDGPHKQSSEADVIVQADDGYFPYFTTGTSHLADTNLLTIQENSNGGYSSIVRFSDMLPSTAYKPRVETQLKYVAADKSYANVGALVRMKEVSEPFVWVFKTVDAAEQYIKTGDKSNVLPYLGAGPWCSGNPDWQQVGSKGVEILMDNTSVRSVIPENRMALKTDTGLDSLVMAMTKVMERIMESSETVAKQQKVATEAVLAVESNTNHVGIPPLSGIPVVPAVPLCTSSGCADSRRSSFSVVEGGGQEGSEKENSK